MLGVHHDGPGAGRPRLRVQGPPRIPGQARQAAIRGDRIKAATTDEATIRGWWGRWPHAGIATPTGPDWFVLDVDDEEALDRLIAEHEPLPPTVEVVTPRPGRHVYLRGATSNGRGRLPAGLDVRGCGGYVLLPPSPHKGGTYEWRTAPDEIPIALAPAWLMDLLSPPAGNGTAPAVEGAIPDRERNTTLTSLAGTMRRRGLHEDAIAAALLATNAARCKPPLSEAEVYKIAHSVSRYPPGEVPAGHEHGPSPVEQGDERLSSEPRRPTTRASDLAKQRLRWLWTGRLALGYLAVWCGAGDIGKSMFAAWTISQQTMGGCPVGSTASRSPR